MTRYLTLNPGDMIWMGTDGVTQNMKSKTPSTRRSAALEH